ncbi:MAG TPA: hypothetical protein PLP25_06785 [Candidatus Limiplasma sp.]|nr:hypothetical protein [Candidatus Limiplasma sp.]HPS81548.1 hypothetical protein [Candidatus Limiplasma sp.]
MLRESGTVHELDWCEKTMSVLREKQYEACERRLSAFPAVGLFSPLATDYEAQQLLECSFYANEPDNGGLATIDGLRAKVLSQLPVEALYLSNGESVLLERLLVAQGRIASTNWDEIDAAEALARRLWCSFSAEGEEWVLELPEALQEPLLLAFNDPMYTQAKARLFRYDATIHGLLYIAGFLHSAQPLLFFMKDVMQRQDALAQNLAYRYMKATFDYMTDLDRAIILVHPGLADPNRLIVMMGLGDEITLTLNEDTLAGGMNGLLPEEEPLHEAMRMALEGYMRPEWDAEEAAEDLRILAKQGVSLAEMSEVMASVILVKPTQAMRAALVGLYQQTPHWIGMTANLQH